MYSDASNLIAKLEKLSEEHGEADATYREDSCSCVKDDGEYGSHGWHWRVNPKCPESPQNDEATERCPHYKEADGQDKAPF